MIWRWLTCVLIACLVGFSSAEGAPIDFGREVWPIFRRACIECHGPEKQEGSLRLDSNAALRKGGDSGVSIIGNDPAQSELIRRVSLHAGHDEIMPARGAPLNAAQIELLREWIRQGSLWPERWVAEQHWAYVKPVRPSLPAVRNSTWARNAVDYFVLRRLEHEGLQPSPEADRAALIRRLSLDLVGLPPSPREVAEFVQDEAPGAYERLVDRLLASDQFGVRWARPWLDYARYADSHGFQRDDLRDLWLYRDWVVDALNDDLPFDQFTIRQLAGDLLPEATTADRIATGFNRCAPTNVEAGSDPEETRVNQVFDRVNTLGMIWLGMSLECAQCHDHKYDPISQRDYYQLFAFFNQTALEADRADAKVPGSIRFIPGGLEMRDPQIDARQQVVERELNAISQRVAAHEATMRESLVAWEQTLSNELGKAPREEVLVVTDFDSLGGATHEVLADKSVLLSGEAEDRDTYTVTCKTTLTDIRAVKLETLTDPSLPGNGPGRGDAKRPNFVLNRFAMSIAPANGGESRAVRFVEASADFCQQRFDVRGAIDNDPQTAWAINPQFHEPHWARFETDEPVGFADGSTLTFTLEQNFGAARTIGRLRLTAIAGQTGGESLPGEIAAILKSPSAKRSPSQTQKLVEYRLRDDRTYANIKKEHTRLTNDLKSLKHPSCLVTQELSTPRASTMFVRGDFRTPGEPVAPGVPGVLHPLQGERSKSSRLDLARWLVDRENPLVARVTVNRWWGELFGHGLVTTPEDFGIKGEPPTHPELLDWLAVEFVEQGWSFKYLLKQIVMSSTYRQSSRVTPELLAKDDQNLLYARGPRFRLDAETIRDQALSVAGLLSGRLGGVPIRPYQPSGLWNKVGGETYEYVVSPGDEKFRRGLFVVLKRGAPYPSFVNFDGNSRMACRVRRARSNTPLQALTLLNDPVYVEAAQAFALRIVNEAAELSLDERLTRAFELALARAPKSAELNALHTLYERQLAAAEGEPAEAKQLAKGMTLPAEVSAEEFSAWYAIATALINLDEFITKN